jgi:hypothetical protein
MVVWVVEQEGWAAEVVARVAAFQVATEGGSVAAVRAVAVAVVD